MSFFSLQEFCGELEVACFYQEFEVDFSSSYFEKGENWSLTDFIS